MTGSTNDDARAAAVAGAADGHVVVADRQERGRGARGRAWDSPGGTDLYLSIVTRLALPPAELPPLTLAVGLGVARAVAARTAPGRVRIKWPNDVLLDDLKCAGILVESVSAGARIESVVVGVGLDVGREDFGELEATSLRRATGLDHDRGEVLAELLGQIEASVDRFVRRGSRALVEALDPWLAWRGERVECDGVTGTLEGLGPDGSLRLAVGPDVRSVRAGTLRRVAP